MSRRRPGTEHRASCAEVALNELCVTFGYCIPPVAVDEIMANPPASPDAFLDAVLVAEGRNPVLMSMAERRPMLDVVMDWVYDDGSGRGGASGRARFPSSV